MKHQQQLLKQSQYKLPSRKRKKNKILRRSWRGNNSLLKSTALSVAAILFFGLSTVTFASVTFNSTSIIGNATTTIDTGSSTLQLQTVGNGPIQTGGGLFTIGGTLAISNFLGSNGCLTVATSGIVSTSTCSGGGKGNPAGTNGQLQYNNAGAFAGASGITTDGTDLFVSSGTINGLYTIPTQAYSCYHAFGDSITAGAQASVYANAYVYRIAEDTGMNLLDDGISGSEMGDVDNAQIFPNENPTSTKNCLYTIMVGTNEAQSQNSSSTAYQAVFTLLHQAGLAWLAIPSEFKVFGQNPSNITSGQWAIDNTYQTGIGIESTSTGATLTMNITTYGGPIYAWYRINDTYTGQFNWSLDGGTVTGSATTFTNPPISTPLGSDQGVGLIRIPDVSAGSHSITFTVTSASSASGVVSILAIGTVPNPNKQYWESPIVFSAGIPYQTNNTEATMTAAYNSLALADAQLLHNDGLQIYPVNVRNYINATTDMSTSSAVHPNDTGHLHLADAFEAVMRMNKINNYSQSLPSLNDFFSNDAGPFFLSSGLLGIENPVTGSGNTGSGYQSLANLSSGNYNTGTGFQSLYSNTTASYNTATGYYSLAYNSTGTYNTATGFAALKNNTVGSQNTAMGYNSLAGNLTGNYNSGIGFGALSTNASGSQNIALGANALGLDLTGSNNVAVGVNALNATTNSGNVALGSAAGYKLASGSNNVFIGNNSGNNSFQDVTSTNSIAIGNGTYTTADNQIVLGNTSIAQTLLQGNVSVGSTSTPASLYVANASSTIRIGTGQANPGCIEMYDSVNSSTLEYIYSASGSLVTTTTKPSFCQ